MGKKNKYFRLIQPHFNPNLSDTQNAIKVKAVTQTSESVRTLRRWVSRLKNELGEAYYTQEKNTKEETMDYDYKEGKDTAELNSQNFPSSASDRPKILKEFLQVCQVDESVWYVDRYQIGASDVTMQHRDQDLKWDSEKVGGERQQFMEGHSKREPGGVTRTNYNIKVYLKRKAPNHTESAVENLIKKLPTILIKPAPKFTPKTGVALEMSVFDAHFGKLSWENEIGRESMDLHSIAKDYDQVIDQNLSFASVHKPEKIFYVVGQDLFHTDNNQNKTSRGDHVLDVDTRMIKIFNQVFESVVRGIGQCAKLAPVEVVWVPGNHDEHTSWHLCHSLSQVYRNEKRVSVDIDAAAQNKGRKARLWGDLLVGWTHRIVGREASWVNALAHEFPKLWGESKFREWHFGDQHKKKEIRFMPTMTNGGVLLRQLTALSNIDKWHYENLYTDAVPGGEAFLWSKDVGVFSNLTAWVGEKTI